MGEWHVGYGFDFLHLEYSKIGLPSVEQEKRIVIRTEVLRSRLASNRLLEHPAQRHSIDDSGMHAKPNDLARVLVHHDQYPVRSQGRGLATEQIDAPQTVLDMTQKGEPGWTAGSRVPVGMNAQDTANHILVDLNAESQRDLLGNSRTAPVGITSFHFDDGVDELWFGPFGPDRRPRLGENQQAIFSSAEQAVEDAAEWKTSDTTSRTGNAFRAHEQSTPTSDDTIRARRLGARLRPRLWISS